MARAQRSDPAWSPRRGERNGRPHRRRRAFSPPSARRASLRNFVGRSRRWVCPRGRTRFSSDVGRAEHRHPIGYCRYRPRNRCPSERRYASSNEQDPWRFTMTIEDILNRLPSKDEISNAIGLQPRQTITTEMIAALGAFGTGIVIGAGLALLFAPKTGRELRQDIADRLGDLATGLTNGDNSHETPPRSAANTATICPALGHLAQAPSPPG